MKNHILISMFFLVISQCTWSQSVLLVKKDGSQLETKIRSYSNREITTTEGDVQIKDISAVNFEVYASGSESLYEALRGGGVKLSYSYKRGSAQTRTASGIVIPEEAPSIDQLQASIEKFRVQSQTGKVLELVGAACIGASVVLSSQTKPNYDIIKGLAVGGSVISITGFVVDLDALRHLRKRR